MPLEQVGNALKFLAFFTSNKQGKTGLTVTVDVWGPADTLLVTAGAATEVGDGLYKYVLAVGSVTTEGGYVAVFKTTDGTVDAQHIAADWWVQKAGVENLDAPISSRAASGAGLVTTVAPLAQTGVLTLIRGDDYNATDGRALDWTDASGSWPDLTGATITFAMKAVSSAALITKTGSVLVPSGAGKKVRVELAASDITGLIIGTRAYTYDVQATISGRKDTLISSSVNVREDYSP